MTRVRTWVAEHEPDVVERDEAVVAPALRDAELDPERLLDPTQRDRRRRPPATERLV